MQPDHYATLGLCQSADPEVIKAAYRALAKKYHPDRSHESAEGANRKMAAINDAYAVLCDPESRAEYDASYQGGARPKEDAHAESYRVSEPSDWEIAAKYFPVLDSICEAVQRVEPKLAQSLKGELLGKRRFADATKRALALVKTHLNEHYAKDEKLCILALTLKLKGNHAEAEQLARAVRITQSPEKVYEIDRGWILETLGIESSDHRWYFEGAKFRYMSEAAIASARSSFDPPERFPDWLYHYG